MRELKVLNKIQLEQLHVFDNLLNRKYSKITIEDNTLTQWERQELEKKVNGYYFSCGCETAAMCLLLGGFVFLVHGLFISNAEFATWDKLFTGVLLMFACTIIGKMLGLLRAEILLRKTIEFYRQ